MEEPKAALLIIGAEILSGKIQDENGPFLVKHLRARGVATGEVRVVDDDMDIIIDAVTTLKARFDYVLTTGGIGPTHDDVTLAALAQAFNTQLVRHAEIWARIRARHDPGSAERKKRLAEVPAGAQVILGSSSIVPVINLDNVYVFPGVPELMRHCFFNVASHFRGKAFISASATWRISETRIAETLSNLQDKHPEVAIGSYPTFERDNWQVKVTVDGREGSAVHGVLQTLLQTLPQEALVHSTRPLEKEE